MINRVCKANLPKICLHVAQIYIYLLAANLLLAATFFFFGISISWWLLPISFVIAISLLAFFYDSPINKFVILEISFAIVILIVLIAGSALVFDQSFDGNMYHKLAIGLLKNGWVPFTEQPYGETWGHFFGDFEPAGAFWTEVYAKATWIFGASVYALTGNIECGKVYTVLAMVCTFLLTFAYLSQKQKSLTFRFCFSTAAAFNPIAIAKLDSFYVDGYLQLMLYMLVLSLIMHADDTSISSKRTTASLIAATMIVVGNIKFSGLLYGGVYCIIYYLWFCYETVRYNRDIATKACIASGGRYALLAGVTIFYAGNTAYLTNIIRYHNIGYPLLGANAVDIMTGNSPFSSSSRLNWLRSIFGVFSDPYASLGQSPNYKLPFTFDMNVEPSYFALTDVRLSGFGPFFSGCFILAIFALVVWIFVSKKDKEFRGLLINSILAIFLCFAIEESWWARYSPYIFFIVLLGIWSIFRLGETVSKRKFAMLLGVFLSLLTTINAGLYFIDLPREISYSKAVQGVFDNLKYKEIFADYSCFSGVVFNLEDSNVEYIIDNELHDNPAKIGSGYMFYFLPCEEEQR